MSELERKEMTSEWNNLHFFLPGALQMTHPMDLFAMFLSEVLKGQNCKLHGKCTSNSSICFS